MTSHYLGYPINTLSIGREKENDFDYILVGGGGGPGKSGVKNQLSVFKFIPPQNSSPPDPSNSLEHVTAVDFTNKEDAVWSLAMNSECSGIFAGVNPSKETNAIFSGRYFSFSDKTLVYKRSINTIKDDSSDYQCTCAFSPNNKFIATGSDLGQLSLVSLDTLSPFFWSPQHHETKIYSICFAPDSSRVILTCAKAILGYEVETGKKVIHITPPSTHTFRCCHFHSDSIIYVAMNKDRHSSYLCTWDLAQPTSPRSVTYVAKSPIVSMTVRNNLTAVGLVDCSIHVFRDHFYRVWKQHDAHIMPVTGMVLTTKVPSLLVSASSDGLLKVWSLPLNASVSSSSWKYWISFIVMLVAVLLAWTAIDSTQCRSAFQMIKMDLSSLLAHG